MTYATKGTDATKRVDSVLDDFFLESIKHAAQVSSSYATLWESLHRLIMSGGKRLRPQMTMLAYEAFGGKDINSILPIAASQELLHFCLLVHDDIIDRDYVRYGTANIAGQYKTRYSAFVPDAHERTHYAHSAAILGGDLMLSGAYQLLMSSSFSADLKLKAQTLLVRSIFDVAGGELLDTESSFVPYTAGDALKIAKYKTASYSFIGPLVTGAELAGANEAAIEALSHYANALGVAFQLVDDLLGVFGSEETTGKSTSGDIREGKRTYMIEQALDTMNTSQRELFDQAYGNPNATADEVEQIRRLLIETGAKGRTEAAVAEYARTAKDALDRLELNHEYHAKFERLIIKVTDRTF